MSQPPIADYALLSDCHTAALVSRDGSIDWLCFPRFDSPAIFARILDEDAGSWSIRPTAGYEVERRYRGDTMLVETTFRTPSGVVTLLDALAVGRNERGHELGAGAPGVLLRQVEGIEGEVEVELVYAPRPEYGLVYPLLMTVDGGVTARGGAELLALSCPVVLDIDDFGGSARFTVRRGEIVRFALSHASTSEPEPALWPSDAIAERFDDTAAAWHTWSELHQAYEGPWRDLVHHSGRVLYALTYYPTGAICAAPTTSLPETPGGARNWDYRYAWVRDASFTLQALWVAACPDEAGRFFEFMACSAASLVRRGFDLQIMFGVGGERDLSERELPQLKGWRGSAPVRVGNGAWTQRQLDVYGELLDAAYRLPEQLDALNVPVHGFLVDLADTAATRWHEQDQGIWEVRGEPRDFLYSKLMCWVALDRAIALADRLHASDRVESWQREREAVANAILTKGWNDEVGAFTQFFGSDDLDASNLMMPIVGFLPAHDPHMLATIDAIAERLVDERGLVYRYRAHDGLEGEEGSFLLCTFWLAHALALADDIPRAREVFERAIAYVNDVGLLAEEVDSTTGELLGNFPQAFSHIGLVNAAWAITEAEARAR
ncbi:MAG TPA: glycoside hydrolase family 15 protein [Acidimicrobiia bacterium]|nr:glycoside hydrolase family 15 protein [Acidimicrobiia bacterium]